jgi:hypothetical protein
MPSLHAKEDKLRKRVPEIRSPARIGMARTDAIKTDQKKRWGTFIFALLNDRGTRSQQDRITPNKKASGLGGPICGDRFAVLSTGNLRTVCSVKSRVQTSCPHR